MFELFLVLYNSCDLVAFPLKGEGVDSDVVVRQSLDKVQCKHWRKTKHKRKEAQLGESRKGGEDITLSKFDTIIMMIIQKNSEKNEHRL